MLDHIITEKINKNTICYVSEVIPNDNPKSDWFFNATVSLKEEDACKFSRNEAIILARILSNQVDETGYSAEYKAVKN